MESDPKASPSPTSSSNLFHTMAQTEDSQKVSQDLSETEEFKQNEEAPRIPGYMLLQPIGRGAYAQVWEAIQVRTHRFVAVKVFLKKAGVQWMFLQREVERLIRLDKHPNIVSMLDADFTADPPYYVMDLAREGSLEKHLDHSNHGGPDAKGLDRIVQWMEQIASALAYVHAKQMVHCDLKPANVLLDEEGNVRVADFGHSRVMSESGSALGTLFYMAPEQAIKPDLDHPLQPDGRWDIYAMGCTVYALVSGLVPHREIGQVLENTPETAERLRIYRDAILGTPVPELHILTKGKVDRDLSAIVAKCMHPNPLKRYASVNEVLKDLKNRREGKPVSPLSHDPAYWLGKFVTRFWLVLLVALLALCGVFAAYLINKQKEQSQLSDQAFSEILRGRDFLDKGDQPSAVAFFADSNKLFPSALARGSAAINMPPIPLRVMDQKSPLIGAWFTPSGKEILTAGEEGPLKLWNPETGSLIKTFKIGGSLQAYFLSSDGGKMVVAGKDGDIRLLNLREGGSSLASLEGKEGISCLALSPDGKYLIAGNQDGTAQVFTVKDNKPRPTAIQAGAPVAEALFSPDSSRVLTLNKNGIAQQWNPDNADHQGDPVKVSFQGAPAWYLPSMAYSPDGKTILFSDWDGNIRFYDHDGHKQGHPVYFDGSGALFNPLADGKTFMVNTISHGDGMVRIFSFRTHQVSKTLFAHKGRVLAWVSGGSGKMALTAGADHQAHLWEIATGKLLGRTLWHGDAITTAALSPSGRLAVTGGKDGLVRLWDLSESGANPQSSSSPIAKVFTAPFALFSHDGKKVLTFGGKAAQIWDTASGNPIGKALVFPGTVSKALFSPDDSKLLIAGSQACLWVNLATGDLHPLDLDSSALGMAFSPDGKFLSVSTNGGKLFVSNLASGPLPGSPVNLGFKASRLSLHPADLSMIAWQQGGSLACLSLSPTINSKPMWKLNKGVEAAALNPAGTWVAVASSGSVQFHEIISGTPKPKALKPGGRVVSLSYSPEGQTLLSLGADGKGQLWKTETGEVLGTRMNPPAPAQSLSFSPGGEGLAGVYGKGLLQFWDSHTGEPIGGNLPLNQPRTAAFASDSKTFFWLGPDGVIHTLDSSWLLSGRSAKDLILQAEVAGQAQLNSHGSVDPIPSDDWLSLFNQYGDH